MRGILALSIAVLTLCINPVRAAVQSLESQVVQSINGQRQSAKQHALSLDPRLSDIARQHSQYLSRNTGSNGLYRQGIGHEHFRSRAEATRQLGFGSCGENVYAGRFPDSNTAHRVVNAWLNSKGHRKNMLGHWDTVGVGIVKAPGGTVFATAIFATHGGNELSVLRLGSARPMF